jgi:hypothetical protein
VRGVAGGELGIGTIFVRAVANGSFALALASNAQTDRIFGYVAVGSRAWPLEHFPEKWTPIFRRKCDQISNLACVPIHLKRDAR